MKRPTSIKVLNLDYEIHWHDEGWHEQTGSYGQQNIRRQVIRIDESAPPQLIADTFLHEVVHAVFDAFGLEEKAEREEPITRRLATGLCTIWKDNPKAFAWWQSLL